MHYLKYRVIIYLWSLKIRWRRISFPTCPFESVKTTTDSSAHSTREQRFIRLKLMLAIHLSNVSGASIIHVYWYDLYVSGKVYVNFSTTSVVFINYILISNVFHYILYIRKLNYTHPDLIIPKLNYCLAKYLNRNSMLDWIN